jgi:hypothetical protein
MVGIWLATRTRSFVDQWPCILTIALLHMSLPLRLARGLLEFSPMSSHLSSVAMLVDFSASQWTARKIDKARSAELTDANKAHEKIAHVSKKLVVADTLQAISALVTRARDFHKSVTSPWLDNGARILSAKMHSHYTAEMERFESEFWPYVETFIRNYPSYIDQAAREHVALGKLFNRDDYPKETRISGKFAWRNTFLPIPDAADFRVDIGQAQIDRIKADITDQMNAATVNAVRDVFERAHDMVGRMVEALNGFDPSKSGKERGIFRDSVVDNIRELVDLMPGLNFTDDKRIAALCDDMRALTEHDANTLRESDNIRATIAARANDMVQQISDFMA